MGFSETFGVEKGSGTRVVEWLNSEALAKKYKIEFRLYGYKIDTENFGSFEMISWMGDVQSARKLITKASKRFKIKAIEGGYKPSEKTHGFALESFEDDNMDSSLVIRSIREYLASVGEDKKYAVTAQNKTVTVSSISGEQMKSTETKSTDLGLFSCTHCGYVTRFETDLNAHRMIHYL